ncbi:ABC transporter permease [Bradyrhizobium sp.]|uniref:ABC transporter permease n=1 Tax=Bradyrhizobium sp. TaxID=376 RepID=UPI00262C1A51|nr:ABC transporter permease [Bradyrhizobium sp.]
MLEFVQIAIGGLVVGSMYAAIALGFSLIYRVTGAINLAQGGFALIAALIGYTFGVAWGWPLIVAIPAAVIATVIAGVVLARFTFVPALARLSNANVLMLTAGILTMIEGFSLVVWGSQPYATPPFSGEQPLAFGGITIPTQAFWVFGATALIIAALWFLIAETRLGKGLRACAENPAAASLMGIDVPRMTLFSFGLATLIAAIAGVIVAPSTSLQFDTGRLFTISGFVAAAIGGMASFPGAIIGGLFLGLVTQLSTAYISSLFSSAISLLILLVVLIWRPQGLIAGGVARRQDTRDDVKAAGHAAKLPAHLGWPLAALAVLVAVAIPFAVTDNGIMSSLVIAAILFMALMGLDVLMGYAGQVSLGQAGFMAIGGYTSGYLAINTEIAPALSIFAGIGVSLACALVLSVVTLRLRGLYLALATLAFGLLIDSCAVGFIDITGGPSGLVGIPSFSVAGFTFATPRAMYYLVLALDIVILLGLFGAMRSGFGRALQAIRSDQMAAAALGINTVRYKLAAFLISVTLASLAGSLYAFFFNFLAPEMVGTSRSLELVAMLIIGGESTLVGGLFGALLLTLLPVMSAPLAIYKTFASGALLVASFLHLPQGIYGVLIQLLTRLAGARGEVAAKVNPVSDRVQAS